MVELLIVEDEVNARLALKIYFERVHGWTVHEAGTAHEAIELIPKLKLDAAVIDRRMPDRSGRLLESAGDEVMRWLYERRLLADLCAVMLTAYGELDSASNALTMGAWQYLKKPLEPVDLYRFLAPGIALKKCHRLRRRIASQETGDAILNWIQEVVQQTLAPDMFHVIFLLDSVCRDMMNGEVVDPRRRFVREIRDGKPFLYAGTREAVRDYDPVLPDAGTLMAVRVVTNQNDTFGAVVMESKQEGAFDARWQEVLGYLADLVGLSETIKQARARELENLKLLDRELRHRLSNSIGTMYQHAESIMACETAEPKLMAGVKVIKKHLDILIGVVNELRDVTKGVTVSRVACSLSELLVDVLAEKRAEFDAAGVTVGFGAVQEGVVVLADREKLEYSLECLLRNALESVEERRDWDLPRPSEAGADVEEAIEAARRQALETRFDVTISVEVVDDMAGIHVRDEGIGFDQEIQARLFAPLFTTKTNRSDRRGGVGGMGLFTVKRYIEAMGGQVSACSPGARRGADFAIRLPLQGEAQT